MNAAWNPRRQDKVIQTGHISSLFLITERRGASDITETDASRLPDAGEPAVVRCPGFQCVAYRDSNGVWREAHSKERLPEVLDIVLRY